MLQLFRIYTSLASKFQIKCYVSTINSYRNLQAQLIPIIFIIDTFYLYLAIQTLRIHILVQMRKLIFIDDTLHETNTSKYILIFQVLCSIYFHMQYLILYPINKICQSYPIYSLIFPAKFSLLSIYVSCLRIGKRTISYRVKLFIYEEVTHFHMEDNLVD